MTTTPSNSSTIGLSKLDRRIAVAPMMDCTDEAYIRFQVSCLRLPREAW